MKDQNPKETQYHGGKLKKGPKRKVNIKGKVQSHHVISIDINGGKRLAGVGESKVLEPG